jgi:hypothetical protein
MFARDVFSLDNAESPMLIVNKEITAAEAHHSAEELRDMARASIQATYEKYGGV